MGPSTAKRIGEYEKRRELGRGTYGTVYDGEHVATARRVALKKVLGKLELGRAEAALLRRCRDAEHVVQLLDEVEHHGKLFLVLEFMDSDLEVILQATEAVPTLSIAQVKAYVRMILEGVAELHDRHILHRDLKPNNLLIAKDGRVPKISDFGMATQVDPEHPRTMSIQVVTRAYRAPELFFGLDTYDGSVDVWSVGCIFAELLLRKPFFEGTSDIDQLSRVFNALGSPTENGWTDAAKLPFYLKFKDTNPTPLREQFPQLSEVGVDLLGALLQLDPTKRITARDALAHPFFTEDPKPAKPSELPFVVPPEPMKKRTLAELLASDEGAVADTFADAHAEADPDANATTRTANGVAIKGRRIL